MARVENKARGARELNALKASGKDGRKHFPVPGATTVAGVTTNGSAEVPDDVLDELLAKDVWTKAMFGAKGDLVDCRRADSEAAESDKAAKAAAEAEVKAKVEADAKAKADAEKAAKAK